MRVRRPVFVWRECAVNAWLARRQCDGVAQRPRLEQRISQHTELGPKKLIWTLDRWRPKLELLVYDPGAWLTDFSGRMVDRIRDDTSSKRSL